MAGTVIWGPVELTATSPQYVYFEYSGTYSGLGYGDSGVTARICDYGTGVRDHSAAVTARGATYSGFYNFGSGKHIVTIEIFNGSSGGVEGKLSVKGSAAPTLYASTFTAANVNFGNTSTVNISNTNISSVKHAVTWAVGGYSHSEYVAQGVTSVRYTIPTDWLSQVPNATSGTLTIYVQTMNSSGTQIGAIASANYTVYVPTNIVPSIGSLTAAIHNPVSGFNQYIQGMTGAKITINNPAAGSGATIQSYSLALSKEENYTLSGEVYTISKFANSGDIKCTVTVTDSRGRTASKDITINVTAYSKPGISQTVVYRCDSNETEDDAGTYARVMCVATKSNIPGNSLYIDTMYYKELLPSDKYTGANNMASGTYYLIGGDIDPNVTYIVQYRVYDTICGSANAVTITNRIETSPYSIHIKNGGNGVAFGKTSERDDAIEIRGNWDLYYKGKLIEQLIREICESVING